MILNDIILVLYLLSVAECHKKVVSFSNQQALENSGFPGSSKCFTAQTVRNKLRFKNIGLTATGVYNIIIEVDNMSLP